MKRSFHPQLLPLNRRRGQLNLPISAPNGNTGAEISASSEYRIDFIEVFHPNLQPHTLAGCVGLSLNLWQKTEVDFYGYHSCYTSPLGHKLYCDKSSKDGFSVDHCKLICSGKTLPAFQASMEILRRCIESGAKISRLDLALDDRTGSSSILKVLRAFRLGDFVTHFRDLFQMSKIRLHDKADRGTTLYLGSATSERRIRIYDKAKEQEIEGDWIRYEAQARKDSAQLLAINLLSGVDPCSLICSLVDFRQISNRSHSQVAPRLSWWQAVVSDAIPSRFSPPRPIQTLERRARWLTRQASRSMALFVSCLGVPAFVGLVNEGFTKLSPDYAKALNPHAEVFPVIPSDLLDNGLIPF